jgi:hypothetical protein
MAFCCAIVVSAIGLPFGQWYTPVIRENMVGGGPSGVNQENRSAKRA